MTTVTGKNGEYEVGELVAKNDRYRLRHCRDKHGREMLLQIATHASKNAELSRAGWALTTLKERSDEVERAYSDAGHSGMLNYDLGFPELTDSFIFEGQGARQVNILRFREILKVGGIIPLLKIWKDDLRVDLPTSAWIFGKLIKTVSFAHDNRIQVNNITGNNVLIEPDQHYVVIFNWSDMVVHETSVPSLTVREEIKLAANLVIRAVGGDLDKARVNDADLPYTRLLQSFATEGASSAAKAHGMFYEVVDSLCGNPDSTWKNGFHPFATLSL